MKIWDREILDRYAHKHAGVRNTLQHWISIVEESEWKSHNELKMDFPSADYVGNERYIFNIQGNKYRLVAVVVYIAGIFKIRFIGTHSEYDKIDCKTV